MGDYDAFLVELLEYTGKQSLADLAYEELNRATNKVCKQIFGAKPNTEQAKTAQANIKRKVKMEWKKATEAEPGTIKTSMYEEKAAEEEVKQEDCVIQEPIEIEAAQSSEHAAEAVKESVKEEEEEKEPEDEKLELPCDFGGFDWSHVVEEAQRRHQTVQLLAEENFALKLANGKMAALIDGLCLGSSIVLSGLLVVLLLYKFI